MNVSSQSGAEACLFGSRYLTIKAELAQKLFWEPGSAHKSAAGR